MTTRQMCDECDGEGRVEVQEGYYHCGTFSGASVPRFVFRPCEECDGTGEIDKTETFSCPKCGHKFTTNAGTMALLIRVENRVIYCAECSKLVRDDEWIKEEG